MILSLEGKLSQLERLLLCSRLYGFPTALKMTVRVASTSFIGALPESVRDDVLGRIRELASAWPAPLRLGYTTEAFAYERR